MTLDWGTLNREQKSIFLWGYKQVGTYESSQTLTRLVSQSLQRVYQTLYFISAKRISLNVAKYFNDHTNEILCTTSVTSQKAYLATVELVFQQTRIVSQIGGRTPGDFKRYVQGRGERQVVLVEDLSLELPHTGLDVGAEFRGPAHVAGLHVYLKHVHPSTCIYMGETQFKIGPL